MNSLRRQLTRSLLGTLTLLLGAALIAIALFARHELLESFDAALQTNALAVSSLVETEEGRVQFDFSDDFLRGFGADRPRNYFEIWDATNVAISRSPSLAGGDLPRQTEAVPLRPKAWNLTLPNGRPGRAVGFSFDVKPADAARPMTVAPRVQLVVAVDRGDFDETVRGLVASVAGCGVLLCVVVWLIVPWVLRRGLAPLDRLGAEVARIDANSLTAPLPVADLPEELRPVGDRLNALLARLAMSFERERRFSADLAHELRTPIAELRSAAECALKWPESRDPAADRDVLAIAEQMEALVTRMLMLARGERGHLAAHCEAVEVAGAVEATLRQFAARAAARGLDVKCKVAPATVVADAVLLRGILGNLIGNATDHAPAGAELRISGEATPGGGYRLRFANPATELTADDVTRMFERFWRKEAARSGAGEHVGLGLSLAQMFAEAMGWRLSAALEAEGWLVFTLERDAQ